MAQQTKNYLKALFENGDTPTQDAFWDWLDSFFHKSEMIPITSVNNLQNLLDNLAPKSAVEYALPESFINQVSTTQNINVAAGVIAELVTIVSPADATITLLIDGVEVSTHDVLANKKTVVQLLHPCDAATVISIQNLPLNSNLKFYKR